MSDIRRRSERLAILAAGLTVLVAVALFAAGLALSPRGLDLLDGAYQLRLIDAPQASRDAGEVYLFGFLLHPVFVLVGRDVAVLRVLTTVILAALAGWTARELVRMGARGVPVPATVLWPVVTATATTTLLVRSLWERDPGYRWVALVGLLLVTAGMARAESGGRTVGAALLGAGLAVTAAGKPTSAVAAALLVLVVLVVRQWFRREVLVVAVVAGLATGALVLLVAGMTPGAAVSYHLSGARMTSLLGAHSSVPALLGVGPPDLAGLLLGLPVLVVGLGAAVVAKRAEGGTPGARDLLAVVLVLLTGCAVAVLEQRLLTPSGQGFRALSVALVLPLLALAGARAPRWRRDIVVVAVFLMPWAYAVGSNVDFALVTAQACGFWVAAAGTLAARRATDPERSPLRLVVPVAVTAAAASVVTGVVGWAAYADGARGLPLSRETVPAAVAGGHLLLAPREAAIASRLRAVAETGGVRPSTPVVDLTGIGAGYALELGGRPLGRAHLYGTWPGGVASARYALGRVPCADRAAAWLLYAPDNPSDVSPAFTGDLLDLTRDYTVVDRFTSRQFGRDFRISVLRPGPSVAERLGC